MPGWGVGGWQVLMCYPGRQGRRGTGWDEGPGKGGSAPCSLPAIPGPLEMGGQKAHLRAAVPEFPWYFLRWKYPLQLPLNTFSDAEAFLLRVG